VQFVVDLKEQCNGDSVESLILNFHSV